MTVEEKLSTAKSKLVIFHPFFASIVCNLPMDEDNSIPTMATNGKWVKYNRDFVDSMTLDEVIFVLAHEVCHCIFGHMFRRKFRDPHKWNVAADYVSNDILVEDKVGTMPKDGLYDPQLVIRGGGTAEGVYDILPDTPPQEGGYSGTALDECVDATGDASERSLAEAQNKVMVAQAAQVAKMVGKLSARLSRLVNETLQPKVDWRDVLRRFVSARAKSEYTYARPKRRFVAEGLYLPSLGGERMGEFLVAVDCSGSIGPKELNEFAAEIKALKEDCLPTQLHVVYFDSEVSHHDAFGPDDQLVVAPHGGGGTAFSPIFRFAEARGIEPVGCVVLTDLCCHDFGPPPPYPTLWVSNMDGTAPWGEVVLMNHSR